MAMLKRVLMYKAPARTLTAGRSYSQKSGNKNALGYWLLGGSGIVFGIIVLGGVTRLTESGLSMVDWSILHFKPPGSQKEWEDYFTNVNKNMSLEEFKKIYFMEYAHRMAGRFLGAYFFFPSLYFMKQNWKNSSLRNALLAINILIGFQGLLGWYMVKSGLSKEIVENNQVPRVSHFRLAAHLGSALVIYAAMLKTALTSLNVFESIPKVTIPQKMIFRSTLLSGLVFCTAISGALVAGLDAGMIYNSFPLMGNSYIPTDFWPQGQTFADLFNNPSAVQFMHRNLAITTIFSTSAFWLWGKRYIPHRFRLPLHFVAGVALAQGALGVLTLLYTVPISLASAHQAGSVTLLTSAILLQHQLKKIAK